jgi:hypothetical protein
VCLFRISIELSFGLIDGHLVFFSCLDYKIQNSSGMLVKK